ncbi:hypothetical protein ACWFMI_24725 [Nocardiopsis terrae]|uniref:hypothetical protein n=1 Tax=Streptomyces sp. NPDC057554 TaxID=3350538 RepID=UPI0036D17DDE
MHESPPRPRYDREQTAREVPAELRATRISAALEAVQETKPGGPTWEEVATELGIVAQSIRNVRRKGQIPQQKVMRRLEEWCGWAPGGLLAVMNGAQPEPAAGGRAAEPLTTHPPVSGFRWSPRGDDSGHIDYELTFEMGGQDVSIRVADLGGESHQTMQQKLLDMKRRILNTSM